MAESQKDYKTIYGNLYSGDLSMDDIALYLKEESKETGINHLQEYTKFLATDENIKAGIDASTGGSEQVIEWLRSQEKQLGQEIFDTLSPEQLSRLAPNIVTANIKIEERPLSMNVFETMPITRTTFDEVTPEQYRKKLIDEEVIQAISKLNKGGMYTGIGSGKKKAIKQQVSSRITIGDATEQLNAEKDLLLNNDEFLNNALPFMQQAIEFQQTKEQYGIEPKKKVNDVIKTVSTELDTTELQRDEGYFSVASKDGKGISGGYGHRLYGDELERYPIGTKIPEWQAKVWWEEDTAIALDAANAQIKLVNEGLEKDNKELLRGLRDINYQLGFMWNQNKDMFPTAWQHMKEGNYERAALEFQYADVENKIESDWYKQTPKRVKRIQRILRNI